MISLMKVDPFESWFGSVFEPWVDALKTERHSLVNNVLEIDLPGLDGPPEVTLQPATGSVSVYGKRNGSPVSHNYTLPSVDMKGEVEAVYRNGVLKLTFAPVEAVSRKLTVTT